jgi:hypothetical protein
LLANLTKIISKKPKYFNSKYIITLNDAKNSNLTTGRSYSESIKTNLDFLVINISMKQSSEFSDLVNEWLSDYVKISFPSVEMQ